MGLDQPKPPLDADHALAQGRRDFGFIDDASGVRGAFRFVWAFLRRQARPQRLPDCTGVEHHVLGIDQVLGAKKLEEHPAGWRFLISGPSAAYVVDVTLEAGKYEMAGCSSGGPVDRALEAVHSAEKTALVSGAVLEDYRLLLLSIPPLFIDAIWLKSQTASPDLVVPFSTLNPKLQLGYVHTAEKFLEMIQPVAEEMLKTAGPYP